MSTPDPKSDHHPLAKRKTVLFFQGFQLRYTALVAGSLAVFVAFAAFYLVYAFQSLVPADVLAGFESGFSQTIIRLVLVGIIYVIIFTVAAIFLSHRLVGPTHRIEEELRKIGDSDAPIEPLKVREGDEFEGLVHSINKVLEKAHKIKK